MSCLFQTVFALITSACGFIFGAWSWRIPVRRRIFIQLVPLLIIFALMAFRFFDIPAYLPSLYALTAGRLKFLVLSFAVASGLTAPLPLLPHRWERYGTASIMAIFVFFFTFFPFVAPALAHSDLTTIASTFDTDGVCIQDRSYTCATAAAVSALAHLGLPADQTQIALLSSTNQYMGTLPWSLYTALDNIYEKQGLQCRYQTFKSIDQLKDSDATLAIVKSSFMLDHCVAVLGVSEKGLEIADPSAGYIIMKPQEFEKIWRFSGITLKLTRK